MDELIRAKKRALYLLTDMDRTEKELYEKLKKSGYPESVISETMAYVRGFGYLDDDKYARHYIEAFCDRKSKTRISFEMTKKGLSRETIEKAFSEAGDYSESELIRRLALKKAKTLNMDDPGSRQKIAAFLARQGFHTGEILSVMEETFRLT